MDLRNSIVASLVIGFFTLLLLIAPAPVSAQACFTREQVATDTRCLYIVEEKVYEKGTRESPHRGQACGMDVTKTLPAIHKVNIPEYLTPNYRGEICKKKNESSQPALQRVQQDDSLYHYITLGSICATVLVAGIWVVLLLKKK